MNLEYDRFIWMELVMRDILNKTSANRTNSKTDETARLAYIYAGADLNTNGDWIQRQKTESLVLIQYAFSMGNVVNYR
jgi:hypothetical protein